MTCEQVMNRAKENPPCTPLKESYGNIILPVPVPDPASARTRACAPAHVRERPQEGTGTESGTGSGTPTQRTGTGTVRRRIHIDADVILEGYNEKGVRNDPVQMALFALNLPTESNGYNNARIMRWHLRRIGEEAFRQCVYQQWRENAIDGMPRNMAAALTAKLFAKGGDV